MKFGFKSEKQNVESLKKVSAEGIIYEYTKDGRIDLGVLPKEKLIEIKNELVESLPKLKQEARTEILEQLILLDAISDKETFNLVEKLETEEVRNVGRYIGKIIDPGKYLQTFHACFEKLEWNDRQNFIDKFSKENPDTDSLLMVAPFINMGEPSLFKYRTRRLPPLIRKGIKGREIQNTQPIAGERPDETRERYRGEKEDKRDTSLEHHSLIGKFFYDIESAERLMNLILETGERHPELTKTVIDFYSANQAFFLFPYLPELLAKNLITEKIARDILTKDYLGEYGETKSTAISFSFYKIKEEEDHKTAIRKKITKDPDRPYNEEYKTDPKSTKLKREMFHLQSQLNKRVGNHILTNFTTYTKDLKREEKMRLITCMFGSNVVPILSHLDGLGLNKEEIEIILKSIEKEGELYFMLDDNSEIEKLISLGLEKHVIRSLSDRAEEYAYFDPSGDHWITYLIQKIDKVLPLFSKSNQEKIKNIIKSRAPIAWFYNLDHAVDNNLITIDELTRAVASSYGGNMPRLYSALIYKIRKLSANKKEFQEKISKLRVSCQTKIKDDILYFIKTGSSVLKMISEEDVEEIVLDKLKNQETALEFAIDLMGIHKSKNIKDPALRQKLKTYEKLATDLISKRFKENPSEVINISDYHSGEILNTLGEKVFLETIFLQIKSFDANTLINLLEDYDLLDLLLNNKKYLEKLLNFIEEESQGSALTITLEKLDKMLSNLRWSAQGKKEKLKKEVELNTIIDRLIPALEGNLRKNRFHIFERIGSFNRNFENQKLNEVIQPVIKDNASEYLKIFPGAIENVLELVSRHDHELYNNLIRDHLKLTALTTVNYRQDIYDENKLDKDVLNRLTNLDPVKRTECAGVLEKDYYLQIIDEVQSTTFFSLFEKTLNSIAKEEITLNGETKEKPKSVNQNFTSLVKELVLLNNTSWLVKNKEEFLALSKPKQKELISLAKISFAHNLNDELKNYELDIVSIKNFLGKKILLKVAPFTGIELPNLEEKTIPDPELINVIFTYLNYWKKSEEMETLIKKVFESILQNNYINYRAFGEYETKDEKESLAKMKSEGLLPKYMSQEQYGKWLETKEKKLKETLELSIDNVVSAIHTAINKARQDDHIDERLDANPQEIRPQYDELLGRLTELNNRVSKIAKEHSKESEEYKEATEALKDFMEENEDKLNEYRAFFTMQKLKNLTIDDLEKNKLEIDGKMIGMDQVFRTLEKGYGKDFPDIKTDIEKLKIIIRESRESIFGSAKISKTELKVTDKVDPKTHFLIGEIPVPSCQNYKSNGDLNIGLLSYVIDPSVKIVQVYDENEVLVSRNIMRLLENKDGEPQIFLERIYSTNAHPKIEEAVISFAKSKAIEMGVSLYSEEIRDTEGESYEGLEELYSRGSRTPYVYTDAGAGKRAKGIYLVRGRKIV